MPDLFTLAVFAGVASGTAALLLAADGTRARALRRLTGKTGDRPQPKLHSRALIWRELVSRFGNMLPASSKDLPRLRRRLIRAGCRNPNWPRYFQGIRAVSVVACGVLVVLVAGGTAGAMENLLLAAGAGLAMGYMLPNQCLSLAISRRERAIARGLPNALDLMVICVESGLGMDQTTLQVAKELERAHPEIADEFTVMNLELRAGKRRADALHNLAERTGVEDVRKLVAVLIQTDRFGTSIAQSLRGHADYLRTMARQRAEERASKLAVKLVFPIFFCVLPSLFVVTVGPVLTRLVRDLLPMIENM
jgi:tight adherence protein C